MGAKKVKRSKARSVAAKLREATARAMRRDREAKVLAALKPPPGLEDEVLRKLEAERNPVQAAQYGRAVPDSRARMRFGDALAVLRAGGLVARDGWNGRGMFLYLVPASSFIVSRPPLAGIYPLGSEVYYRAHIDLKDASGQCVPWLASQADILASDWVAIAKEDVR